MPSAYAVDTDIANLALGHLGKPTITSIDGNSVEAKRCKFLLPLSRRTMLMASDWSFARETKPLAALAVSNPYEGSFTYVYDRPDVGVKLWGVVDPIDYRKVSTAFLLEQGRIYTSVKDAKIRYTDDVTSPAEWTDPFADAVALDMAMRMAPSFTRRRSDIAALQQQRDMAVSLAIEFDAMQEPQSYARDHTYIEARGASVEPGRPQTDGSTIWGS